MRGIGSFNKTIETIVRIKESSRKIVKLNTVLCKENKGYLEFMIELADNYNIDCVNFAPLRNQGRAVNNKLCTPLTSIDMYDIVKKINELRGSCRTRIQTYFDIISSPNSADKFQSSLFNQKTCAAGVEVLAINSYGDLYGCVVSPANEIEDTSSKRLFTAGNIAEGKFLDIWHDSSRWRIYRDLNLNKSKKCISNCSHYAKTCFGNCIVESYAINGKLNEESPLCFSHLLEC